MSDLIDAKKFNYEEFLSPAGKTALADPLHDPERLSLCYTCEINLEVAFGMEKATVNLTAEAEKTDVSEAVVANNMTAAVACDIVSTNKIDWLVGIML